MNRTPNYYTRSICNLLALLCLGSGCAGANQVARDAQRLTFAELNGPQRRQAIATVASGPTVIHFERGQRIPLELVLDSKLIELEAPRLTLIAKRDFDLLLRPDGGIRLSSDGVDFESHHENYFGFGFEVERQAETLLRVKFGIQPAGRP
jgi:hypothetical protein